MIVTTLPCSYFKQMILGIELLMNGLKPQE